MINLNRLLISLFLISLISCNHRLKQVDDYPANSRTVQVSLIDSLGSLTVSIPIRYDTSFSWIAYSDCGKPCNEQKYRFQPKTFSITKESGFMWLGEPKDSFERFTISNSMEFPFFDGDTAKNVNRHNNFRGQIIDEQPNQKIVYDTIQKINDRYFSIFAVEGADSLRLKKVFAETTIKHNIIKFQLELLTPKKDSISENFIKNSINIIKTIHISKGT